MGKSSGGGKGGGGGSKGTPMTSDAASRIQSAGDRHPDSSTATSGFGSRAQSAAAENEADDYDDED